MEGHRLGRAVEKAGTDRNSKVTDRRMLPRVYMLMCFLSFGKKGKKKVSFDYSEMRFFYLTYVSFVSAEVIYIKLTEINYV